MSQEEKPVKKLKDFLSQYENNLLLAIMVIYVMALALVIFNDVFELGWF